MSSVIRDKTPTETRPRRSRRSTDQHTSARSDWAFASDEEFGYPAVDPFAPEMDFRAHLSVFRGPMDLLLYLVRKQELDVADVRLSQITDQYLEYLEILSSLDIDTVGDFIEVASTLIEIKSRLVLPQVEEDQEERSEVLDDPREELVQRLLEYKKYKDAASILDESGQAWQQRYARVAKDLQPPHVDPADQPIQEVELWDLVSAIGRIMRESQLTQTSSIIYDETPMQVYMQRIHERLVEFGRVSFSSMFEAGMHKTKLISNFLAILELARNYGVVVEQEDLHTDMWLTAGERFNPTLEVTEVFVEEDAEFAIPGKPR